MTIDEVLRDHFDPTGFSHFRNVKAPSYTADQAGLLRCADSVLRHQAILVRELIFEEVRREKFPGKPSRRTCAWLIPHEDRILAHWCATAPDGQFRVYEVEATGNIHIGASRHLKPACLGGARLRENAVRFWSERVDDSAEPAEVLLCGEMTPLREFRMPGSKESTWRKLKRLF